MRELYVLWMGGLYPEATAYGHGVCRQGNLGVFAYHGLGGQRGLTAVAVENIVIIQSASFRSYNIERNGSVLLQHDTCFFTVLFTVQSR